MEGTVLRGVKKRALQPKVSAWGNMCNLLLTGKGQGPQSCWIAGCEKNGGDPQGWLKAPRPGPAAGSGRKRRSMARGCTHGSSSKFS